MSEIAVTYYGAISQPAIMTLYCYFGNIIKIELDDLCRKLQDQDPKGTIKWKDVSKKMLFIKSQVNTINRLLGSTVMITFTVSWIVLSMAVCLVADYFSKSK